MTATLVFLPSPLLGPSVWRPVSKVLAARGWDSTICDASSRMRTGQDVLDAFGSGLPEGTDCVLVPHSNAGAYVPALTVQHPVVATVFVDAVLPPPEGQVPLAPPALLELLRGKADDEGLLPPWTRWWEEADVASLGLTAGDLRGIEREQRRLPLSYFEGALAVPPGWDARPAAYLAFGETYAAERGDAAQRGWPVRTLPGGHLHQVNEPQQVADTLVALLDQVGGLR